MRAVGASGQRIVEAAWQHKLWVGPLTEIRRRCACAHRVLAIDPQLARERLWSVGRASRRPASTRMVRCAGPEVARGAGSPRRARSASRRLAIPATVTTRISRGSRTSCSLTSRLLNAVFHPPAAKNPRGPAVAVIPVICWFPLFVQNPPQAVFQRLQPRWRGRCRDRRPQVGCSKVKPLSSRRFGTRVGS